MKSLTDEGQTGDEELEALYMLHILLIFSPLCFHYNASFQMIVRFLFTAVMPEPRTMTATW